MVSAMPRAKQPAPDQEFRQARMRALVDHADFGTKAALGRALNVGAAYIRQMIDGERPITEKTIAAIHAMQAGKFKGWFNKNGEAPQSEQPTAWPLGPHFDSELWDRLDPIQRGIVAYQASKIAEDLLRSAPLPQAPIRKRSGGRK